MISLDQEDEIGRLWSDYILYYSLKFNYHVYDSGEKENPTFHATKFTLSQLLRMTRLG